MSEVATPVRRPRRRWSLRLPFAAAIATILSSICLGETFLSGTWFLPTAFGVAAVIGGCELARRESFPRVAVPIAGLLALVLYLVLRYARGEASLGFLPDLSALQRLLDIAAAGSNDISRFAAPITVSPGVELITVAGVGLIALLVDTLAVTARRAALAGLPMLALYTVPAALAPNGVNWQAFALAGAGYLGLLLTEFRERVSRWGRPMRYSSRSDWHDEVHTAPLAQLGRRVGAAALGLAVVVPAVVPQISLGSLAFGSTGFGRGDGVGKRVATINPIVDLGRDLRQSENRSVIRYRGPATYLRMVVLDAFDGTTWKPSALKVPDDQTLQNGLPRPPGLNRSVERGRNLYKIQVLGLDQQWLPLPYPPSKVKIEGRWLYDIDTFNVFATNTTTRDKTYTVSGRVVQPTPDVLRSSPQRSQPSSLDRYVQLPLTISPVVKRTALGVTKTATTDYDKALALQNWLRDPGEFNYSPNVPRSVGDGNGAASIAAFLEARTGYCVHFASTMAVMARLLDIPARVAVGFTPGKRDEDGRYVVGLRDAHSWPELYFEGVGWVAFEPTPADRTGAPPPWAQLQDASEASAAPSATPSPTGSASSSFNPNRTGEQDATAGGAGDDRPLWQRLRLPLVPTLVTLGLVLLALLPAATRRLIRRRRWHSAHSPPEKVAAAWTELHDTLLDFNFRWHDSDSPRRGAARVAQEMSLPAPAADAVRRLGAARERLHYATSLGEIGDLRGDVAAVDAALAANATRRGRIRARLLPRSTRAVAAALAERFADLLDASDAAAAQLRSRLVPGPRRSG